jgi:hypothetical protein
MVIGITIISIFAITGVILLINRIMPYRICPICAGVFGTWLWILAGMYFGVLQDESWRIVAAIAMGGSVVGVAYKMEKYLSLRCSPLLWKTLFIPTGFVAVYSVLLWWWLGFAISASLLAIWLLSCRRGSRRNAVQDSAQIEILKKKMKNCC